MKSKKTFAERAQDILKYYKDRKDPISKRSMEEDLRALQLEQEAVKQKAEQAKTNRMAKQFAMGGGYGDPPLSNNSLYTAEPVTTSTDNYNNIDIPKIDVNNFKGFGVNQEYINEHMKDYSEYNKLMRAAEDAGNSKLAEEYQLKMDNLNNNVHKFAFGGGYGDPPIENNSVYTAEPMSTDVNQPHYQIDKSKININYGKYVDPNFIENNRSEYNSYEAKRKAAEEAGRLSEAQKWVNKQDSINSHVHGFAFGGGYGEYGNEVEFASNPMWRNNNYPQQFLPQQNGWSIDESNNSPYHGTVPPFIDYGNQKVVAQPPYNTAQMGIGLNQQEIPGTVINTDKTNAINGQYDPSVDFRGWNGNSNQGSDPVSRSVLGGNFTLPSQGSGKQIIEPGAIKGGITDSYKNSNTDPYYIPEDNAMRYAKIGTNIYNLLNTEAPKKNVYHPISPDEYNNKANLVDRAALINNINGQANTTRAALGRGSGDWNQYARTLGALEKDRNTVAARELTHSDIVDNAERARVGRARDQFKMYNNQSLYRVEDMNARDLAAYNGARQALINGIGQNISGIGEEQLNRKDAIAQVKYYREMGLTEAQIQQIMYMKANQANTNKTKANYNQTSNSN